MRCSTRHSRSATLAGGVGSRQAPTSTLPKTTSSPAGLHADRYDALVLLHRAINDAPTTDPGDEPDAWDTQRLVDYESAMTGRRNTLHRVLARHRVSGAWAGQSLLCVDELSPTYAFQEDTVVVPEHRGHRLGLLMKTEMLRWLQGARPEVAHIDTWNSVANQQMTAVNERLGTTVVARRRGFRLDR